MLKIECEHKFQQIGNPTITRDSTNTFQWCEMCGALNVITRDASSEITYIDNEVFESNLASNLMKYAREMFDTTGGR